ncbi:hypothetical protein ACFYOT_32965 [Saccharothrix saharensis]|uniref:hypothetical protein n=1 Tax=Saccharothrix saharensis TaxID=571190 RepID=UPI0036C8117F
MNQPEMTLPDLPPRRPLPPDVRQRLRRRVLGGAAARAPRGGGRLRAPLATAAAVAVLAAGGVVVVQSTQGDMTAVTPPSSTTSSALRSIISGWSTVEVEPNTTEQDAARCEFVRSDVRFTLRLAGARILVTGDDRFCELTHTAITHDKPGVGPVPLDGPASLLWESGSGVLIGRRAAVTSRVEVATGARTGAVAPLAVTLVEDLFVIPQSAVWMTLTFTTPAGPVRTEVDAQALPGHEAWSVRREAMPPGDPHVAQCLDASMRDGEEWVGDPLRWRPGAATAPAVDVLLVMYDDTGKTAYCQVYHGRGSSADPEDDTPPQGGALFRLRHWTGRGGDPAKSVTLLGGTVDAAKVGGLQVVDVAGRTAAAVLKDGTFAVRLDDQPPLTARSLTKGFRVRVLDHDDRVIETVTLE